MIILVIVKEERRGREEGKRGGEERRGREVGK